VSIDTDLLHAADILPRAVDIWDCTNGARLRTYAIEAEAGSGEICVNGAAAHLVKPGDVVIIASWTEVRRQARSWEASACSSTRATGFAISLIAAAPRGRLAAAASVS
jgi:aspartate 1-decarboxylase